MVYRVKIEPKDLWLTRDLLIFRRVTVYKTETFWTNGTDSVLPLGAATRELESFLAENTRFEAVSISHETICHSDGTYSCRLVLLYMIPDSSDF